MMTLSMNLSLTSGNLADQTPIVIPASGGILTEEGFQTIATEAGETIRPE